MMQKSIASQSALILVQPTQSIMNASIHMLFMRFDIAVIWVDRDFKVVDRTLAKKWHLSYAPQAPAKYIIETHPDRLDEFHIGDELNFD